MHLVLVPPSSLPVPTALQRHEVPTPRLPPAGELRPPQAFVKARKSLAKVGLSSPGLLAFDYALWWQFVVSSVEWNLEEEAVTVRLADGSEERWSLTEELDSETPRSADGLTVDDTSRTFTRAASVQGRVKVGTSDESSKHRNSAWAPVTVFQRLKSLCADLFSAYEDVGLAGGPDELVFGTGRFGGEWEALQKRSSEPPLAASSAPNKSHGGINIDDDDVVDSAVGEDRRLGGQPSQSWAVHGADPDQCFKFSGQSVPQSPPRPSSGPYKRGNLNQPFDYRSMIRLLADIRHYLADLFARTVLPELRHRLPETFSLWAATGAIKWCRREAILRGGDLAQLLVELLDDDGTVFDQRGGSELSPGDILVMGGDETLGTGTQAFGDFGALNTTFNRLDGMRAQDAALRAKEKRQPRLISMKDDLELRLWCSRALRRASDATRRSDEPGEVVQPSWIAPVPPREVGEPVGCDEGMHRAPDEKGPPRDQLRRNPQRTPTGASPSTSPPPEWDTQSLDDRPIGSTDSDSDTDAEHHDEDAHALEDLMPEDPLGEEFLPPKLPKALIRPSAFRGVQTEAQRAKIHIIINKVNGLQHKVVELQEFVLEETKQRHERIEEERELKETFRPWTSALSSGGAPPVAPPLRKVIDKPIPLRYQPLRKQAADRALSRVLENAWTAPTSPERAGSVEHDRRSNSCAQLGSAATRRKQKRNIEAFVKVQAITRSTALHKNQSEGGSKRKRKRERQPPSVGREPTHGHKKKAKQHLTISSELVSTAMEAISPETPSFGPFAAPDPPSGNEDATRGDARAADRAPDLAEPSVQVEPPLKLDWP